MDDMSAESRENMCKIMIFHVYPRSVTKPLKDELFFQALPSGKRSHSDCWNIPIFNRKYMDSIRGPHFPATAMLAAWRSQDGWLLLRLHPGLSAFDENA